MSSENRDSKSLLNNLSGVELFSSFLATIFCNISARAEDIIHDFRDTWGCCVFFQLLKVRECLTFPRLSVPCLNELCNCFLVFRLKGPVTDPFHWVAALSKESFCVKFDEEWSMVARFRIVERVHTQFSEVHSGAWLTLVRSRSCGVLEHVFQMRDFVGGGEGKDLPSYES